MEKKASYKVPLPKKNETKKAILETYTKEYSAEYQSQALIDLAKKFKKKVSNFNCTFSFGPGFCIGFNMMPISVF